MTHAPCWFELIESDAAKPLQKAPNDHAPGICAAHRPEAQHRGTEIRTLIPGGGAES